jgi:hypothetical protein
MWTYCDCAVYTLGAVGAHDVKSWYALPVISSSLHMSAQASRKQQAQYAECNSVPGTHVPQSAVSAVHVARACHKKKIHLVTVMVTVTVTVTVAEH